MTPKVKIFEIVFPDSATGHRNTLRDQIWWKSAVAKLPKGHLVYHTKNLALHGTRFSPHFAENGPIVPKITWTLSPLDMSTYTEFSPGRLHFAGLISERLIFRPKKWLRFRLSAYSNDNALSVQQMCTSYLQFVHSSTNVSVSNRTAWTYHFYWIDRVMICRLMAFSRIHQLLLRLCVYVCMCVCVIMS